MTKQEIINYMYENHVQGDFKIEEMAEDLAQPEIIRCKDCRYWARNTQFCGVFSSLNIAQRMPEDGFCSYGGLRGDSDEVN